ncbi:thrombospondin-2-like isoform X1 [Dreissena polymorpha]|uniref:Uncharacterized protein n=2 Tax=Dreissena polymorpha TaxID=45954 RepID=A0A9D4EIV5_DREPO|nr:thrombospondin-2-like isoform X1 [Dreissena polymorpha]KAH3778802.1 hypothetical protein DPMN_180273 [Dreissena polymorpha]
MMVSCGVFLTTIATNCMLSSAFIDQQCKTKVEDLIKSDPCPVNGGWSDWSAWSDCSTTCGTGLSRRSRACFNPAPSLLGQQCDGDSNDYSLCYSNPCKVDGFCSEWESWFCSFRKPHTRMRQRTCYDPLFGGQPFQGNDTESYTDPSCT